MGNTTSELYLSYSFTFPWSIFVIMPKTISHGYRVRLSHGNDDEHLKGSGRDLPDKICGFSNINCIFDQYQFCQS